MNDIADRMCKSVDTIKACKRSIFAKLGMKNIAEALFHVANYQLMLYFAVFCLFRRSF